MLISIGILRDCFENVRGDVIVLRNGLKSHTILAVRARSSVGERFLDTEEAVGSIPSAPTTPQGPMGLGQYKLEAPLISGRKRGDAGDRFSAAGPRDVLRGVFKEGILFMACNRVSAGGMR